MSVAITYSTNTDPQVVASDVRDAFAHIEPTLVLFFSSPAIDPAGVASALSAAFADSKVIGATSSGEITSGHMLKHSLVAMAFDADHIPMASVQVVTKLGSAVDVRSAFDGFAEDFGQHMSTVDPSEYVGLVLADGLSGAEERLMEAIGNRTNVLFVGGSAGDDLAFECTHVFADGVAYTDAAVLAAFKPAVPFEIIKTQSFSVTDHALVATEVDEAAREVISFDGKPAAEAYAAAAGVPTEKADSRFMSNPVGLIIDGEPYVRSPQRVLDGGTMKFYCNINQGMRLSLLESTDLIAGTLASLEDSRVRLGRISALINFNCILRTLELEERGLVHEYAALFEDVPTVGFSTYGEEYIGHINQTATMLAFG